jgi:hypothetical protein
MMYRGRIRDLEPGHEPRHLEASMRVAHSTLDGLSPQEFQQEVRVACGCVDEGGLPMAERARWIGWPRRSIGSMARGSLNELLRGISRGRAGGGRPVAQRGDRSR